MGVNWLIASRLDYLIQLNERTVNLETPSYIEILNEDNGSIEEKFDTCASIDYTNDKPLTGR